MERKTLSEFIHKERGSKRQRRVRDRDDCERRKEKGRNRKITGRAVRGMCERRGGAGDDLKVALMAVSLMSGSEIGSRSAVLSHD